MSKTSSKRSRPNMLPGAHRQVHPRASGYAIYWTAWRGGPSIGIFRGATLEEAEAAEVAGAAEIAAGYARECRPRPADGTVARAMDLFMTSAEWNATADKTQVSRTRWLKEARDKWGHMGKEEFASEATAEAVGAWVDAIAETSPANAVKAKEAVSRFCSWARARSRKLLPRDCKPTAELETTYVRPVMLPPARDEVTAAIAALPPLASVICELALHSGLRRSDLVKLSDPQIDERAGIIRLGTTKGRKHRRVAIMDLTPPLLAAIRKAQALRDKRYAEVCASRRRKGRENPPRPLTILVSFYGEAFTPSGLYQHVRKAFAAVERQRINPHAFRRASATQKHLNGLSWARIGRELGWSEKEAEAMGAIYVPEEAVRVAQGISSGRVEGET